MTTARRSSRLAPWALCILALGACKGGTPDAPPVAKGINVQPPQVCSAVPTFQPVPKQVEATGNPGRCITKNVLRTMKVDWLSGRAPQPKTINLEALPVQLQLSADGRVEGLSFDGSCGMTYYPSEATRACLMHELRGWRYSISTGECPQVFWGSPEPLLLPAIDGPVQPIQEGGVRWVATRSRPTKE